MNEGATASAREHRRGTTVVRVVGGGGRSEAGEVVGHDQVAVGDAAAERELRPEARGSPAGCVRSTRRARSLRVL